MTPAELRAAIAELDHDGATARAIARQLDCSRTPPEPDEAAIERAAAGDPPPGLTWMERRAAIAQCDQWGLPAHITAQRIGCTTETVHYARRRRYAA
jgi:hypothetical protein